MQHKVNPHTIRVGVIRDWDSKWNPSFAVSISRINGERFKNLQVTSNVRIFGRDNSDIERIVKSMKKR